MKGRVKKYQTTKLMIRFNVPTILRKYVQFAGNKHIMLSLEDIFRRKIIRKQIRL